MGTTHDEAPTMAVPADWAGSPLSTLHYPDAEAQPIPVEQYPEGGSYVIRLEIPGIDPASDLTVSITAGMLTVVAERRRSIPEGRESEFKYGRFARHVALPPGANADDVVASCRKGILTVRVAMQPETGNGTRDIDVAVES